MAPFDGPLRTALRRPAIRQATLGFAAVTLGEWVLGTVIAIELFQRSGAIAVGAVGARFVPAAFASVLLSTLADRRSPSFVLSAIAAARALIAAAALLALLLGAPVVAIIGLVWVDAAVGAGYRPAQARLLPSVARTPHELTAAVALVSTAKSAGQILGALGGSVVLVLVGASGAVLGASLLFTGSAVATRAIPGGPLPTTRVPTQSRSPRQQLLDGLRALGDSPGASRIAGWACARSLLRGVWTSLGVLAALTLLGLGQGGFGVLMAAAGVGTFVGIAISSQLVGFRHLAAPFAGSLALAGLAIAGVGVVGSALAAGALMIGWGAGMAVADVAAQSLLARVVAPGDSARVVGSMEGLKLLAEGLGGLSAPLLAEVIGLRESLAGAGLLLALALTADLRGFMGVDHLAQGRVELLELARGVPLFRQLRVDGLEALVAPLIPVAVRAGEELITQDTLGSRWYLVRTGEFEVTVDGFRTGAIGRGGAFGERGLMRDELRTATVRALVDGEVLALERSDFLRALTGTDDQDIATDHDAPADPVAILRAQPLLHDVDDETVGRLAASGRRTTVSAGRQLFAQGDDADDWMLVLEGEVEITVDGVVRRTLGRGDALGEIAVLHRVPRTAAARATRSTTLFAVPGDALRSAVALHPPSGSEAHAGS